MDCDSAAGTLTAGGSALPGSRAQPASGSRSRSWRQDQTDAKFCRIRLPLCYFPHPILLLLPLLLQYLFYLRTLHVIAAVGTMSSSRKRRPDADACGDDGQRTSRPRGAQEAATGTAAQDDRAARQAAEQATRRSGPAESGHGTNEDEADKSAGAVGAAAGVRGSIPRFDEEDASCLPDYRPRLSAGGADGAGPGAAGAATAGLASPAGASVAENSPFSEIERTLVATVNGIVPGIVTSPLPPSPAHGPSGGSFVSISSHVNYTGALGGAESIIRQVGTESSFTTADGTRYPRVAGETLVKQKTYIFRFSRRLARQIIKGKVTVGAKAIFVIAMCVHFMMSGRQIAWKAPDGSDWTHADAVGTCQWWLLVPKPTARLTVNRNLQTLTKEEQSALQMSGNDVPADLVNALLDGDNDKEEEAAELDNNGGRESELELDG